jgi:hypothetical protein
MAMVINLPSNLLRATPRNSATDSHCRHLPCCSKVRFEIGRNSHTPAASAAVTFAIAHLSRCIDGLAVIIVDGPPCPQNYPHPSFAIIRPGTLASPQCFHCNFATWHHLQIYYTSFSTINACYQFVIISFRAPLLIAANFSFID